MKEYLIIGGTNDGKRIKIEDTLYITLPNQDITYEEANGKFIAEQYKKALLTCWQDNYEIEVIDRIYALDGMTDYEILETLINNYAKNN